MMGSEGWRGKTEEEDILAEPPGCIGANSVRSHTLSPIASQRSFVLLCWPTSSAVMVRVIVGM